MSTTAQLPNPFVGLRPFESEDSLYYFGRSEQSKALLRQLHATRFLAVVGSSGCGKSSLVRAGLIPNLEAGFLAQDRDFWQIAIMKPGDSPLHNLARAMLTAFSQSVETEEIESLVESISRGGAQTLVELARSVLDRADANLLLVVDQFEELFRFRREKPVGPEREDGADFVNVMLRLAEQTETPIYVCLTMRSDFLGDCDGFYGLPEAMNRSQYLVPRLTRTQRREAITGPIRLSGATMAARLLDRLLNESIDTPDDLPVLQHALMRTWDLWQDDGVGPIDLTHYEAIGTIHKALSNDCEDALKGMTDRELFLTERLFQALTMIDANNRRIRQAAKLRELAKRTGAHPSELWQIIEKFRTSGRSFLVASAEDVDSNPLIDISHESLIRQWATLSRWLDQEAESVKTYVRLAETALLYNDGKAGLYRDPDLQVALDWQVKTDRNEVWAKVHHKAFEEAMSFLQQSKEVRDFEIADLELQRRWQRWRGFIAALVLGLYLDSHINLGFGLHSFWERMPKLLSENLLPISEGDRIAKGLVGIFITTSHLALYLVLAYVGISIYRTLRINSVRKDVISGALDSSAADFYEKRYAGFWRRVLASLIDFVVLYTLFVPVILLAAGVIGTDLLNYRYSLQLLLFLLIWLYEALMISSSRQATLGKKALGIIVTNMKGERVSFARATARFLGKFLSFGFFIQPFTAKKQALHDMLAGSLVMHLHRKSRIQDMPTTYAW